MFWDSSILLSRGSFLYSNESALVGRVIDDSFQEYRVYVVHGYNFINTIQKTNIQIAIFIIVYVLLQVGFPSVL